jgi:hypothetical protein
MIAFVFMAIGRPILDALPKGPKYNQDHFIDCHLLTLNQLKTENPHHKVAPTLTVQMGNSMCHNGATITEKMY